MNELGGIDVGWKSFTNPQRVAREVRGQRNIKE